MKILINKILKAILGTIGAAVMIVSTSVITYGSTTKNGVGCTGNCGGGCGGTCVTSLISIAICGLILTLLKKIGKTIKIKI